MSSSDFDSELYGDLDYRASTDELVTLREQLEEQVKKNVSLIKEKEDLVKQLDLLENDKQVLEKNIVQLFDTALLELKRKDREISDLRLMTGWRPAEDVPMKISSGVPSRSKRSLDDTIDSYQKRDR